MPGCYIEDDGDAEDRAYDAYRQDLLDAFAEGREAGLKQNSVEMNPYLRGYALHEQWLVGWREGLAQVLTKRRAA